MIARLVLVIPALFLTASLARAEVPCEANVTLDDRYETSDKTSVEITNFLNEAFSPFLKSFHQWVLNLPPEDISDVARLFEASGVRGRVPNLALIDRAKGFSAAFDGNYYFYSHGLYDFDAPFTEFSSRAMIKLDRALYVTEYLMRKRFHPRNDRTLQESEFLRSQRTFAGDDLEKQFYYGFLSVAQSVGALIAEPVGDFTAEELLREVIGWNGRRPSLVVLQSLMLPPRALGQNGNNVYFKNALEIRDGRVAFSPLYAGFMRRLRDEFLAEDNADSCELGHGCPVAHKLDDELPSLQVFLDTVMYVYDRLP